ncbi:hypothetical protein [Deinococcus wulumuqiensis]|uniref:Uncharacterized protein n=1 Tax=Deinococcus wulumuqiensis TaxID=980427 RepID=A0AAV4K5R0_9DEIO|nr:hypothetical protein [Deinococcus wulumuqiensis]GGI81626.1 hypothetical protein GCM10010914_14820 [Deinococcus wulumuqiensis]GGP30136.1 hypothetical protein GCM10008021_17870 [Deinococcus wulumuqiensis]
MNLDSWTPTDKARRLATLVAAYLAVAAVLGCWLGLAWPWYFALLAGVALYAALYFVSYAVFKQLFGR